MFSWKLSLSPALQGTREQVLCISPLNLWCSSQSSLVHAKDTQFFQPSLRELVFYISNHPFFFSEPFLIHPQPSCVTALKTEQSTPDEVWLVQNISLVWSCITLSTHFQQLIVYNLEIQSWGPFHMSSQVSPILYVYIWLYCFLPRWRVWMCHYCI